MTTSESVEGVLPVDKPAGPTSHDIVGMTRRALRTRRVGHTGTLDPFASGLLLICIGRATRIAEYLTGLPKAYVATLRLGQTTDTDDFTGRVVHETDAWRSLTRAEIDDVLTRFRGDIMQVPSAFSAKKVAGERAYVAAREGRALALDAVPVRITRLEVLSFEPPHVELNLECSSGTYVRALARDIGEVLGVGAHLTTLRRTMIGPHDVSRAINVDQLGDVAAVNAALISPLAALGGMAHVTLIDDELARIRQGQSITHADAAGTVALVAHGELVAIGEADGARIRPRKVFAA
jgi:tRNA pseudouridine55 synthase